MVMVAVVVCSGVTVGGMVRVLVVAWVVARVVVVAVAPVLLRTCTPAHAGSTHRRRRARA